MDFEYTEEEQAFRQEVRDFLDENLTAANRRDANFMANWLKKVREKRWVGFSWPKEVGGGGGNIMQQVILKEEMASRKAPPLGTCMMGLAWVGPAIIQYGTEEQKQRFIPDILDSKYHWCTGYSEPNVGSDLASLQCKAVREGDFYIVNGTKIWTSLAPFASWISLLVRTSSNPESKHEGITALLVKMDSPGIEVRPIEIMAGGAVFAQVFFDEVKVPVDNRLGEEGNGWKVTISSLANERSSIGEVTAMYEKLERLKELVRKSRKNGKPARDDVGIRRQIAVFEARIEAMRLNGFRYLTKQIKREPLSSETSVNKLHRANLEVEMTDFAVELLGQSGLQLRDQEGAVDGGSWATAALSWPDVAICGGTPNIQKNIIAERILGLPKD
ncbi:MAG: acyl-CoA dehydrogenase family protein [Pseudomonadales bacterium]|jgi:alkylation response protein AidB-like acyl-CoA dehydrogenase|nr:acyl-CoA dehydrogenase family protein [Pseudomonadales bacterium]MDP7596470.1 acyl-CoA dehydrogenase family protein [Pseudomonadales bacterium]HJN52847.1 acyl-CoA dehydrogenase family protein [Pseudomonadales bacterium]